MRKNVMTAVLITLFFLGCGNETLERPEIQPVILRESTFLQGDVLVNFRADRVNNFQSAKFIFNGSVRNNGAPLENARFEIISQTQTAITGNEGREVRVEAIQEYGRLESGQVQPIALSAEIPNVRRVTIQGRFASGPPTLDNFVADPDQPRQVIEGQ